MANPLAAALDVQRRQFEAAADLVRTGGVAAERADRMAGVEVGTTPSEVVYRENKLELLHYVPEEAGIEPEETHDVPILIVYALINKPYILDLQPNRSVVRTLLENGFDVYLVDWGEPSTLDSSLTLEDYVDRYVDNCVDVVRERSGLDAINLLGYCMGGTMSAMYAALHPEKVRNLGLMAAGLCFQDTGGVLELWGEGEYYSPETVVETFGNVPADFLDVGFAMMDPVDNFVTKYVRLFDNLDDENFVENFARMERWIGDGIDVAGAAYREFLEDIYQDNELYRNELYLGGKHVDLGEIDMPVLQIVGEYDHLIPPDASSPFNEVVASEDTEVKRMRSGHIGLSVSSSSHRELWPDVCEWFADRSVVEEAEPEAPAETSDENEAEADTDAEAEPPADVAEAVDADSAEAPETAEPEAAEVESGEPAEPVVEETEGAREAEAEGVGDVEPAEEPQEGVADLTDVSGVGETYADRLRAAGVQTVEDLATADPGTLAEEIDVGESRVADWVEHAAEMTD